jgi:hypothetical protein
VQDKTQDDAAAFGVALPEEPQSRNFEVWQENWEVVLLFMRCQTQWRTTMSGLLGLDYTAVAWVLKLYEIKDQRSMLEDLQVMEAAAMQALNNGGS